MQEHMVDRQPHDRMSVAKTIANSYTPMNRHYDNFAQLRNEIFQHFNRRHFESKDKFHWVHIGDKSLKISGTKLANDVAGKYKDEGLITIAPQVSDTVGAGTVTTANTSTSLEQPVLGLNSSVSGPASRSHPTARLEL
ncbi:hypothetical protein NX059_010193 [Plenodomus lindquistii]|nr:hypothetical protein NX059_010193 [Plenodomus lindquistii]